MIHENNSNEVNDKEPALKPPVWVVAVLGAWISSLQAQTLDEQYDFFLSSLARRCQNMQFEVNDELELLPGQAGPRLAAFCSGPPPVGGVSSTAAQGGGTGSAGTRDAAAGDALRRRRDRLREEEQGAEGEGQEWSLLESGKAAVFLGFDYQYEKQRGTRYEAGHRSDLASGTLGADYRFGTRAIGGIALTVEKLSGKFAAAGGEFDTSGRGAVLYASWIPRDNAFVDGNLGLTRRDVDTQRIVGIRRTTLAAPGAPPIVGYDPPLAAVRSSADSRERHAELRAGYDFTVGRFSVGPRVALTSRRTTIDAITEHGETPMTLVIDEQTERSLSSEVGVQMSGAVNASFGVFLPQINADWIHEHEADQRALTARFAEDLRPNPSRLRFLTSAPDRDFFRLRIGAVAVLAQGVSGFIAVDTLVGHDYLDRYSAAIGLRMEL